MPRQARQKSKTGVYHAIVRGINRQQIFHDEQDCRKYLNTLQRIKNNTKYQVLGYCLMVNHVHLLLQEGDEDISQLMKRLGTSYAWWYNRKYERSGHVFQGRYRSECIEDDKYLLTVIRYIHQNPVKAKMVDKPDKYQWSSCPAYYGKPEYSDLVQTATILEMFSPEKEKARLAFREFTEQDNDDRCLESNTITRIKDEALRQEVLHILGNKPLSALQLMSKTERDEILHQVKQIEGINMRQISRVTGIGLNIVFKA